MKKLILTSLILMALTLSAHAKDQKMYSVELEDKSLTIIAYVDGSKDTFPDVIEANGYGDVQAREITEADLPMDEVKYRNFWYYNPAKKKIEVDKAKKQKYLDDLEDAEAERDAILQKIIDAIPGLTAEDLEGVGIKKDIKVKKEK